METKRIEQTTQNVILKDRVKLEDFEQDKTVKTFSTIPSNKKVVITIPAYNEEESIGAVINEIKDVMKRTNFIYQIMILDDGSVDKTEKITRDNGVLFFSNGHNKGLAHTFKK